MHSIYKTPGLILSMRNVGEAAKRYEILTKDFGLVRATAEGIRLHKSKLRAHLSEFRLSRIALVRGKTGWRITDASSSKDYFAVFRRSKEKTRVAGNSLALLARLLSGEEKNEDLYGLIVSGFDYLADSVFLPEELRAFETVFVLRILRNLGYIGDSANLSPFVEGMGWNLDVIRKCIPFCPEAIREINKSLQESNL